MFAFADVANLTLQKIGADDQLRSPDQDSHAARTIKTAWPLVRRICLRELTPSFAKQRFELPALLAEPIGYDYAFQLPPGCLQLIELLEPRGLTDYKVEGGKILADHAGPLKVRCIVDVEEVALWDDLFVQSFADRLGWQIGDRISGDLARVDRCRADYEKAAKKAGSADAKQDPPVPHEDSAWVTARWDAGSPSAPYAPLGYPPHW